jgi:hypothetical protein
MSDMRLIPPRNALLWTPCLLIVHMPLPPLYPETDFEEPFEYILMIIPATTIDSTRPIPNLPVPQSQNRETSIIDGTFDSTFSSFLPIDVRMNKFLLYAAV